MSTFPNSEHERIFKDQLIRKPVDFEILQDDLKHRKDGIFTCLSCPPQQNPTLITTSDSAAVFHDDHSYASSTSTPPMSILLPELLLEIFHLLVLEDPPLIRETWDASGTKILATPHLGWICVTHVCRSWRHLGVQTSALWTNFNHGLVLGHTWTEEFISRVKGAYASIPPFDDYPRSIDTVCDFIMDHPPHIRDLTLSAEWTSMQFVWGMCGIYLPMTVSASLDTGLESWYSPCLFGGYAPNLRHLRLYNIIPWTSHTFLQNLIELDVFLCDDQRIPSFTGEFEPVPPFLFPPLVQILDVLDEAPRLERLSLHYAIPREDFTADMSRQVHFPLLKFFSMAGKVRDCVSFLKRLVLPHDTELDFTCIPGLSPEKFQDLFRALACRFHSAGEQCPPIERLELGTGRFDDRVLIRVYTRTSGHAETEQKTVDSLSRYRFSPSPRSLPVPKIALSLAYASPEEHEAVLRDFFSSMPLYDLMYLSVYGCSYIQPEGWRSIIKDNYVFLQNVRFLVLGHDCAQYFFHAIHDQDDFLSGFGPTAFPNLDRLIFRRIDFSTFPRSDVSEASFQDQMLYHLRERTRRSKPLQAVSFFSCQGIDEGWLRSLEEVVKFVGLGL